MDTYVTYWTPYVTCSLPLKFGAFGYGPVCSETLCIDDKIVCAVVERSHSP